MKKEWQEEWKGQELRKEDGGTEWAQLEKYSPKQ